MNLLRYLTNKTYRNFLSRKKGIKEINAKMGAGYYLTLGLLFSNPKDKTYEFETKSGKKALYELLDYRSFRDPWDMTEWATFMMIGYVGQKPINDCTWEEYLEIYCSPLK